MACPGGDRGGDRGGETIRAVGGEGRCGICLGVFRYNERIIIEQRNNISFCN